MIVVIGLWTFLRAWLLGSTTIALENLALRHQLLVLQRSVGRPRLSRWDRIFWVSLSRLWASWRSSLVIVQPATVLAWHRQGFRLYWRWTSRPNPVGRPRLDAELRDPIRRMARENPTWGRRRIRAELALLGYEVAELTVAKYMHRTSPRPSPTWRAFLTAHARDIVAIDFFVVPTITFHLLFVFVVLRHHRRELLHVNVTDHPSAVWTARQVIEAFPEETGLKYLLRDRDSIYGEAFTRRVDHMGFRQVTTAPRAPWQNPFAERVIGSIRRECLDHVIILSGAHLCRVLRAYLAYYNTARPHQSLGWVAERECHTIPSPGSDNDASLNTERTDADRAQCLAELRLRSLCRSETSSANSAVRAAGPPEDALDPDAVKPGNAAPSAAAEEVPDTSGDHGRIALAEAARPEHHHLLVEPRGIGKHWR
jgi:putative transposase